jgi:hypothetical protein
VGSIAPAKMFLGLPGEIACHNYALRFVFGNDWLRRFWTESNEICSIVRIAKLDAFADLQRPY